MNQTVFSLFWVSKRNFSSHKSQHCIGLLVSRIKPKMDIFNGNHKKYDYWTLIRNSDEIPSSQDVSSKYQTNVTDLIYGKKWFIINILVCVQ